jgi:hypothetical protein
MVGGVASAHLRDQVLVADTVICFGAQRTVGVGGRRVNIVCIVAGLELTVDLSRAAAALAVRETLFTRERILVGRLSVSTIGNKGTCLTLLCCGIYGNLLCSFTNVVSRNVVDGFRLWLGPR